MLKARFAALVLIAVLGIAAVAVAQQNQYEVSGSVPKGGTAKKPKSVGFSFGFKTSEAAGNLPGVIQKFSIGFEGMKAETSVLPKCVAATMTANKTDDGCPAKSLVGTGTIKALIGSNGQTADSAAKCQLKLELYNSGGGKAALWLSGAPPTCIATIAEAIPANFVKKAGGTALDFEVPESLRHQLGLDIAVVDVTTTLKKLDGKKGKKKVGFWQTVGCKDKQRDITVVFTQENGTATEAKKTIAC